MNTHELITPEMRMIYKDDDTSNGQLFQGPYMVRKPYYEGEIQLAVNSDRKNRGLLALLRYTHNILHEDFNDGTVASYLQSLNPQQIVGLKEIAKELTASTRTWR